VGIAAGLEEFKWLLGKGDIAVTMMKNDGDAIANGDVLAEMEGQRGALLSCERTSLNLLQRMSGIATMTSRLLERVRLRNSKSAIVGTRKTPWGLLDKRAVHLGGGGTHRLSLSDAVLIKNNRLALLGAVEGRAAVLGVERAWASRAHRRSTTVSGSPDLAMAPSTSSSPTTSSSTARIRSPRSRASAG
jgi:nicotinate-nucleotide pyrophosphorylase